MVRSVKDRAVAALVLAALLVALASPFGVARAQHSEDVTESVQCTTAKGLYAYYKDKYDHATDPTDKQFFYGLMNQYAFQIGYYC